MDITAFVAARRPELVRAAVLMGARQSDAEDLVQITLMKCHKNWHKVSAAAEPLAYVYGILINSLRTAKSRRSGSEIPVDDLELIDADAISMSMDDLHAGLAVRAALHAQSRQHREVIVLRYYVDLSEQQTADVLGIPSGTVKSRTARALAALANDPHISQEIRHA